MLDTFLVTRKMEKLKKFVLQFIANSLYYKLFVIYLGNIHWLAEKVGFVRPLTRRAHRTDMENSPIFIHLHLAVSNLISFFIGLLTSSTRWTAISGILGEFVAVEIVDYVRNKMINMYLPVTENNIPMEEGHVTAPEQECHNDGHEKQDKIKSDRKESIIDINKENDE